MRTCEYIPTWRKRTARRVRRFIKCRKIFYGSALSRNVGKIRFFDPEKGSSGDLRAALDPRGRRPGISGFMRLRNEEDFVGPVVSSTIDSLDELVIVMNRCNDSTPSIVENLRRLHPEKIVAIRYEPHVYPPGSEAHRSLPMDSPHSYVNYQNFSLARTTCRTAVLIDGDDLFVPPLFSNAASMVRRGELRLPVGFSGVNLWDESGEVFVSAERPLNFGIDRGFFRVTNRTFYVHHANYAVFTYPFERNLGVIYFHMKGMKRDRGVSNYDLEADAGSLRREMVERLYTNPRLLPWKSFRSCEPSVAHLPSPAAAGIVPLRRGG